MDLSVLSNVMRQVVGVLQYPVIAVLLALLAVAVVLVGVALVEWAVEVRSQRVSMPELMDQLKGAGSTQALRGAIEASGLTVRQKGVLLELTEHPALSRSEREALALRLIEEEQARYDLRSTWPAVVAKIAPMVGLMGTLIPLGPGLIALGAGDTQTLSASLLVAFDTTVTGLVAAALAMLVLTARRRWYANFMGMLEALAEVVLEEEASRAGR